MTEPIWIDDTKELNRAVALAAECFVTLMFRDDVMELKITKKQAREIIKEMDEQVQGMIVPDHPEMLFLDRTV